MYALKCENSTGFSDNNRASNILSFCFFFLYFDLSITYEMSYVQIYVYSNDNY